MPDADLELPYDGAKEMILVDDVDNKAFRRDLLEAMFNTMQSLLDKLDVLEYFEDAKHSLRIGGMLNKQAEIYEALGVKAPTSSC